MPDKEVKDTKKQLDELQAQELLLSRMLLKEDFKSDFPLFARLNLYIVNKEKKRIPFVMNNVQRKIQDTIDELNRKGKPVRIIILKARQEGVTTYFQGRMIHRCSQKANSNALIVAHKSSATSTIFTKSKDMNEHLPEDIKPLMRASNASELVYNTPANYKGKGKGLNSRISIQTAGNEGIGRGDTYNMVHLSEYAFWEGSDDNSPANQLSAIMEAVPNAPGTEVVIESTAKGMNDFKEIWDGAVAGENNFIALFFPWFIHEEYVTEFKSKEAKEKFMLSMSEYEEYLFNDLRLSLERIHWWRIKLKDKNNDINLMKQENPSTPEEAFIMSGTPVFNNSKIIRRIAILTNEYKEKPYLEGYFDFKWNNSKTKDLILDESIQFVESKTKNFIRLYERPMEAVPYVIGGDTKGEGIDAYAGIVLDNRTHKRVCVLQMYVNRSNPYTYQMYCLGKYYNDALIGIEINFNTGPIDELERLGYPNQYQRMSYDSFKKGYQDKLGWKTTGTTRPLIIDKEINTVEEDIAVFTDITTLREMLTFMYNSNGRPDAISGKHDDMLMADMIANEIKAQQTTGPVVDLDEIDLSTLPKDYSEDLENAQNNGTEKELLLYWDRLGILDRLRRS